MKKGQPVRRPKTEVSERAKKLRGIIDHHSHLYHTLDAPEISDTAYDALLHELIDIEKA